MKRNILAVFIPGLIALAGAEGVALKPDAGITNAPAAGGTVVLDLPDLPGGETRDLVEDDGMFLIGPGGDLLRSYKETPETGTRKVKIRQTKTADGSFRDSTHTVAITAADWSLDAFPEMIVQSLTQESIGGEGAVKEAPFGGVLALAGMNPMAMAPAGSEPVKLAGNGGIEFAPNSGRRLEFKKQQDALLLYRWSLVIFRVDGESGSGKTATLLCVNDGATPNGRSGYWIPRLEFNKTDRSVTAMFRGGKLHQLKSPAESVAADGKWNVALTYRRHGRIFLRVNGRDCGQLSSTESFSTENPEDITGSRIGNLKADAPAWALDGLWLGQSELSEATVGKMEAWALGRASKLPGGAAARAAFKPVVDEEDFPHRYRFDAERWAAWRKAQTKEKRGSFIGQPVATVQPDRSKWVRVFLDDFRQPAEPGTTSLNGTSVGDSSSDKDAGNQIWYSPGTNPAVGGAAICKDGNDRPFKDAYVLDPSEQALRMRLYCLKPGSAGKPRVWVNSQFTSVTAAGVGYSWAGPKGFRVRARLENPAPGLFPCPLWFYGTESLFWRTGERIEFDIIELDDNWDNYGGTHVHNGNYKGLFGHIGFDTMNKKGAPEGMGSLKLAAGKNVAGINAWDGKYHTWEVWIEKDTTYLNCDGVEIARADTTPEYLERLYLYVDTCLKHEKMPDGSMGILGMDEAKSYDMVVDYIEGFAPREVVDAKPGRPFTARPALEGIGTVGTAVTCAANIDGIEDVWYYWHSGGYPRGFGRSNTYTVLPEDKGAEIRCMVKAAGGKDQPEAWTAPVRVE